MTEPRRIAFTMESELGHVTHAQYMRRWVEGDIDIVPSWMMIPYRAGDLWDRIPGLPFSLRLSLRVRGVLRRTLAPRHVDCLYLHTQGLCLFTLDYMSRIPTVISLDATPSDFQSIATAYDSVPATGLVERVKSQWFRKAFSRAAGLVAQSQWVQESLIRDYGVAREKVLVCPPGIDTRLWQARPRSHRAGSRLRLLFVGGDFQRKGGRTLLTAFRERLSGLCELDIVTKDPSVRGAEAVRVHTGLSPGDALLRQLFAEADVFVMPTQGDATPFAILEAMACSLPVVTTRVGALHELVENGVTGLVVPPGDPLALADAVTALATDRERLNALGRAGRARVECSFEAETNYKRLIRLLKEISHRGNGALRES